jgi:hypothetical protein
MRSGTNTKYSMEQIRKLEMRKECMSKGSLHYVTQATSAWVSEVQTDKQ